MNLKIFNLKFKYNKNSPEILKGITAEIKEGSVNVLLGLNGSGKTTLIKLLAGFEKPNEGTICYDSKDLQTIKIRERSKIFAYVPQHANVTNDIPVEQYLSYGTTNTLAFYEHPGKDEMKKVEHVANQLGITHLLDKNLGEISGGELQKVLIACALIQNTEIIILDEPTSALDMQNQNEVLTLLRKIAFEENKTIILSSHNPNHALFLNANVILIKEGEIKCIGEAKELITVDKLKDIYGDSICYSSELPYKEITFK